MNNTSKQKVSLMLSKYPLYKKAEITPEFLFDFWDFHGITFDFFCAHENSFKTFELELTPKQYYDYLGSQPSDKITKASRDKPVNITQHFKGNCRSCKEYSIDLLLNGYSDRPYQFIVKDKEEDSRFFVRKIGQNPPFEIVPDKDILDYISKEDADFYKKALMNLSANYGIGAFVYLRRIVENEIKGMIADISNLEFEDASIVKEALVKYEKDHQMSTLIEKINKHLPSALVTLGFNPIKILYEQLSIGIHALSDEECFERAEAIDTVLKYLIRKIKEENNERKSVKEALKKLSVKNRTNTH